MGTINSSIQSNKLEVNIELVSNYSGPKFSLKVGSQFLEWKVTRNAFEVKQKQKFGPILWSMYTLSDSRSPEGFVLKMSALTGPLGEGDNQEIEFQLLKDKRWISLGIEKLDTDAWVATFRIPNWNEKEETKFQLIYK